MTTRPTPGAEERFVVLVCGGRWYHDRGRVYVTLDAIHLHERRIDVLIHGGAQGADLLGDAWAKCNQVQRVSCPAPWRASVVDRSAGPRRNAFMLTLCRIDLVVAFPGNEGTADMVRRAKAAGVEVREVKA